GQVDFSPWLTTSTDTSSAPGFQGNLAGVAPAFQDDFNRPNSPTLGANWTTQIGAIGVSNSTAVSSVSTVSVATVNSILLADVIVQARVIVNGPGSRAGLVARYSGPAESNFYVGLIFN